jgi:hypothetical protein
LFAKKTLAGMARTKSKSERKIRKKEQKGRIKNEEKKVWQHAEDFRT